MTESDLPPIRSPSVTNTDEFIAWRVIDANLNRVTEGLRVIEEYCRFGLNDAHLSSRLKNLRHEITAVVTNLGTEKLLAARDTPHDVGTQITTAGEFERPSPRELVQANWQRVQQALRVLEEYLKLVSPLAAERIESLRYASYSLAKGMHFTAVSQERLQNARLYVLIPASESEAAFVTLVDQLLAAKVDVIQLRDKSADDRTLLARAKVLRERTRSTNTLFIMNDRPDLAMLAAADGVHVGQEELNVAEVRKIVGADMLVGVSTHDLEQARAAVLDGANYIGCGPTFPSTTKSFADFPGLSFLRQVAAEIALPAFAIGGITVENISQVAATGFIRVAVSGGLLQAKSISDAAALLRAKLSLRR